MPYRVVMMFAMALAAAGADSSATNVTANITTTTVFQTTTITTTVHTTSAAPGITTSSVTETQSGIVVETTLPTAPSTTTPALAATTSTITEAQQSFVVEVSAQLSVDNCQDFVVQPGVKEALAEGMANAAGGGVKAASMDVDIQCSRRRLASQGTRKGANRRLAERCTVTFRITVEGATASDSPAVTAVLSAVGGETEVSLTQKIKTAMISRGVLAGSVSVTDIAAPVVHAVGATTTTPAPGGGSRGEHISAACPRVPFTGAAAFVVAVFSLATCA